MTVNSGRTWELSAFTRTTASCCKPSNTNLSPSFENNCFQDVSCHQDIANTSLNTNIDFFNNINAFWFDIFNGSSHISTVKRQQHWLHSYPVTDKAKKKSGKWDIFLSYSRILLADGVDLRSIKVAFPGDKEGLKRADLEWFCQTTCDWTEKWILMK